MSKIWVSPKVREAFKPEIKMKPVKKKERAKANRNKICKKCGKPFYDDCMFATRKYCCTACKPKPKNRCGMCGRMLMNLGRLEPNLDPEKILCSFCDRRLRGALAAKKESLKLGEIRIWKRCKICLKCKKRIDEKTGVCIDCQESVLTCHSCGKIVSEKNQLNWLGHCRDCMTKVTLKINGVA